MHEMLHAKNSKCKHCSRSMYLKWKRKYENMVHAFRIAHACVNVCETETEYRLGHWFTTKIKIMTYNSSRHHSSEDWQILLCIIIRQALSSNKLYYEGVQVKRCKPLDQFIGENCIGEFIEMSLKNKMLL